MNRHPKYFIFGLILFLVCGVAFGLQIAEIITGTWQGTAIDWLLLLGGLIGAIVGGRYMYTNR